MFRITLVSSSSTTILPTLQVTILEAVAVNNYSERAFWTANKARACRVGNNYLRNASEIVLLHLKQLQLTVDSSNFFLQPNIVINFKRSR